MTDPLPNRRLLLYDARELDAVLDRMAQRMLPFVDTPREAVLVGILRRGEPLAQSLEARLTARSGRALRRFGLRLKRYRDDLTLLHPETDLTENPELAAADLSDTCVLVVDDVLYHGHSLLRAVAYLAQLGAAEIRTVVLVDRGAAQLPVRADVVGLRLDVAPGSIVECHVPPYEPTLGIELVRPAG